MTEHVKPEGLAIRRSSHTETLYTLEDACGIAIGEAAIEWLNVTDRPPEALWSEAIPEQLLTILDSYDPGASTLAAQAFLEQKGWEVKPPDSEV